MVDFSGEIPASHVPKGPFVGTDWKLLERHVDEVPEAVVTMSVGAIDNGSSRDADAIPFDHNADGATYLYDAGGKRMGVDRDVSPRALSSDTEPRPWTGILNGYLDN